MVQPAVVDGPSAEGSVADGFAVRTYCPSGEALPFQAAAGRMVHVQVQGNLLQGTEDHEPETVLVLHEVAILEVQPTEQEQEREQEQEMAPLLSAIHEAQSVARIRVVVRRSIAIVSQCLRWLSWPTSSAWSSWRGHRGS